MFVSRRRYVKSQKYICHCCCCYWNAAYFACLCRDIFCVLQACDSVRFLEPAFLLQLCKAVVRCSFDARWCVINTVSRHTPVITRATPKDPHGTLNITGHYILRDAAPMLRQRSQDDTCRLCKLLWYCCLQLCSVFRRATSSVLVCVCSAVDLTK